jgi:hypothetical protein
MNLSLAIKIAETIGILLGIAAFALITYWKLKERVKEKEHGLESNPERCGRHEVRLDNIEKDVGEMDKQNRIDHKELFSSIAALSIEITKIVRNGITK